MFRVTLQTMSGDTLDLDVSLEATVSHLKSKIAHELSVPAEFQQLVHDTSVLEDSQILHPILSTSTAPLIMVVTIDCLQDDLSNTSPHKKVHAIRSLARLGSRAGDKTIATLRACLEDGDTSVRKAATEALRAFASACCDTRALQVAVACTDHNSVAVRRDAVRALGIIAGGQGVTQRECATAAALAHVADGDGGVRRSALVSLSQCAPRGHAEALAAAQHCLADRDALVKRDAVLAVAGLAPCERDTALIVAGLCLEDASSHVREAGVQALATLTEKVDREVISSVAARLRHPEAGVRETALEGMLQIATKGCEEDVRAVGALLEDPNCDLRAMAAKVLGNLSSGPAQATPIVLERLEHSNAAVRLSAVRALSHVAKKGDEQVVTALVSLLDDEDDFVRRDAYRVLSLLGTLDDGRTVPALRVLLAAREDGQEALAYVERVAYP